MRILLDECVHAGIKSAFPGHEVRTVAEIRQRGTPDATLLEIASGSFDVFITVDRRFPRQVSIASFRLGLVLVRIRDSTLEAYKPLFAKLLVAAETVRPGELLEVS